MNILTLKVGSKYGPEYVNRLYGSMRRNSTVDFNFYCYTDDKNGLHPDINVIQLNTREDVVKQWYKIDFHHMPDITGKCIILDIDYIITDNLDPILEWDLAPNTFGCQERWWSRRVDVCRINGGFQMFYQGDTQHLYHKFYEYPLHWQSHYINIGEATGPVNGEQNFVDQNVNLERSWLPKDWFAKYHKDEIYTIHQQWIENVRSDEPFFLGDEFSESIKMVHFSNAENNMHDCDEEWVSRYWHD